MVGLFFCYNPFMGPILIFDKSFLQSLNPDEAMWLDNFFNTNITPLFFIETLADLEKEIKSGKTPEEIVGSLAYKTPDMSARPGVHHQTLIAGELLGYGEVEMSGRPIISGGKQVKTEDGYGLVFEQSPEEESFERWQDGDFLEVERLYAKAWREGLSEINLEDKYLLFQKFFPQDKPKTLAEIKKLSESIIDNYDPENILTFGLWLIGVPLHSQGKVLNYWKSIGRPPIRQIAPYFSYVLSVDLFFYLGIAADLIGRGRSSHKIDVAYLYYLPFCKVFTSSDKLHQQIVPFFLREDQSFISGLELKSDLKLLDEHYNLLSDEVKARGVSTFAMFPPQDKSFLICKLWDKYMAKDWRQRSFIPSDQRRPSVPEGLRQKLKELVDAAKTKEPDTDRINSDDAKQILIKRMVRGHKGKWTRFPPEVLNRRKNEQGEWEDIPET
jgi:hypothetical protein